MCKSRDLGSFECHVYQYTDVSKASMYEFDYAAAGVFALAHVEE